MKTQSTYVTRTSLLKGVVEGLFGARLEVSIAGLVESKAYVIWKSITKELIALDKVFDSSSPQSEVSVLNASKVDIETSEELKKALNTCESYFIKTKGLFNVNRNEVLDFSGFIKGHVINVIMSILKKAKVKNAFINYEGKLICAVGDQPFCNGWMFTLYDDNGEELRDFTINNESLAVTKTEDNRLCLVKSKDPLEAKILSIVLPIASSTQRHDMSYSFKALNDEYIDLA